MTDTVRGVRIVHASPGSGWVAVGEYVADSLKAMLVKYGGREIWIPKSSMVIYGGRYWAKLWAVRQ